MTSSSVFVCITGATGGHHAVSESRDWHVRHNQHGGAGSHGNYVKTCTASQSDDLYDVMCSELFSF